jgi:hypothetical protein
MMQYSVIGGGPSGILSVLKLIQRGVPCQSIYWIDPYFQCGSLSKYSRMKSNIHSYHWKQLYNSYPLLYNQRHKNYLLLESYPYISQILFDFQQVTNKLSKMVHTKKAKVCAYHMEPNYKYNTMYLNTGDKLCADKTIVAIGSQPKQSSLIIPKLSSLDVLNNTFHLDPSLKIGILGFENTGVYCLKNIWNRGIVDIKIAYTHPTVHSKDPYSHGLKGHLSEWYKNFFEDELNQNCSFIQKNIQKKRFNENETLPLYDYFKDRDYVIDCIGTEPNRMPLYISRTLYENPFYDFTTGIIQGLPQSIGVGSAYPENIHETTLLNHDRRIQSIKMNNHT